MLITVLIGVAAVLAAGALITFFGARSISATHPPKGRFVDVAGLRMHIVELGETRPHEPAILLIHGASANLEDMRALGEVLVKHHRVILVDRPGHGWSELPHGAAYVPLAQQVAGLARLLETLRVSSALVVGHSLGGALAASLALSKPDIVRGLVLSAPVTHPWAGGIGWYYTLTSAAWAGPLFAHTLALPIGLALFPAGLAAAFAPNLPPTDYVARVGGRLMLRPVEFSANAFEVANLYNFVKQQAPQYAELQIPVGIASGDADGIVSPDIHARAIAAAIPDARLVVIPEVGHMPHHARTETIGGLVDHVMRAMSLPAQAQ